MAYFAQFSDHTGAQPDRFFKATIFQSQNLLLGVDCLEPGQSTRPHAHHGRDKFYFVVEGQGSFEIGGEQRTLGPGGVAWAPADTTHSVANAGPGRLALLVGIAPEPN